MDLAEFLDSKVCRAADLARASGLSSVDISRLRTGRQKDVSSRAADALRRAISNYTKE